MLEPDSDAEVGDVDLHASPHSSERAAAAAARRRAGAAGERLRVGLGEMSVLG